MKRLPKRQTFDVRLKLEKARIEASLKSTDPGTERDLLESKLRQIETALHFSGLLQPLAQAGIGKQ